MFVLQSEGISLQAMSCSEELQCCQSEILELRRTVNALEVELQAQHTLVSSSGSVEDSGGLPLLMGSPQVQYMPHLDIVQGPSFNLDFFAFGLP